MPQTKGTSHQMLQVKHETAKKLWKLRVKLICLAYLSSMYIYTYEISMPCCQILKVSKIFEFVFTSFNISIRPRAYFITDFIPWTLNSFHYSTAIIRQTACDRDRTRWKEEDAENLLTINRQTLKRR